MDTIFALASAPGKAGVSVLRVSGPKAAQSALSLAGVVPEPRVASLRKLRDQNGGVLDEALVLFFPAGASFTGEDVVEFQIHGSISVVQALLTEMRQMEGFRLAEAGEFTRRAMDNGRMDLTQVEALSDLIEAETEAQRQLALSVLSGNLSTKVESWRVGLVRAAALLEATIDFADEDVPVDVTAEVQDLLQAVSDGMNQELRGFEASERVRSGFEIAIVGPPNAGKSTLLNYLAGREAAITSEIAGTTRDVIEVRMNIGGFSVTLLDTAGIRQSTDILEKIGIERALDRARQADIRIHLVLGSEKTEFEPLEGDIVCLAKADVPAEGFGVSGKTGNGVSNLLERVKHELSNRVQNSGLISRERQKNALIDGVRALDQAIILLPDGPELYDVISEELRSSARSLEVLLGRIDVENLLDEIFLNFCVGK
ncbi:tRNA uridine-5-carboxymethylaminomethyl(34) synthesis GTPase MnmE [Tropicibacter sp. R15_0]|uniref:tRNA uridine-5-carboxymethylaminomethyl(34) synthesis GTPase MnmE n=1 Tax=Tropicibacter sp. R15_0 TaxID=2821101 RepID=UPI001ADCA5CF|nr:tRNA uridine-5-carboxymethylaminomethyl(34) synthesis GTPase MnmE [Tropicibacter sp. R15_0]MBO9463833.1 tRNA uridine-5-carboxymethylaminomethyl(34) synthesis GTPase MnmE [Tropicibacter sp. R15_0]